MGKTQVQSVVRGMLLLALWVSGAGCCGAWGAEADSVGRAVHRIEIGEVPAAILHTNQFLEGQNVESRTMNHANAITLKYGLMAPANSLQATTYRGAYQGIGVALHDFNPQLEYKAAKEDPYKLKKKSVRGGSWKDPESYIRSAWRTWEYQNQPRSYIGFRCVRSLANTTSTKQKKGKK